MSQPSSERNPFLLMLQPEVVLAAMAKSERLSGLNRHLCRPLDRVPGTPPGTYAATSDEPQDVAQTDD